MTWNDRLCLGRAPDCEGYRGAPCDCFGPWSESELVEAQALLHEQEAPPSSSAPEQPSLRLDPMVDEDWSARLIGAIAEEIRHRRRQRGMSAQQLADACTGLGLPMARSVLANLENGRRAALGVDELIVLARALGVSPLALLFPAERPAAAAAAKHPITELLADGSHSNLRQAAKWFTGEEDSSSTSEGRPSADVDVLPARPPSPWEVLNSRLFVTVTEVAPLLGLDERSVRRALAAGTLPGIRIGGSWRVPSAAILRLAGLPDGCAGGSAK